MKKRPNILFITDDQHRYDYLEMTEKFPVKTPSLARLAREGVWHRHAYSNCPLCMPARCSLHNGLYAHQHGLTRNLRHWPLGLPTLPKALSKNGYHTAAIGKLHVYEGVPERLDLATVRDRIMGLGYDELIEVGGKSMAWSVQCDWTHDMAEKGLYETYLKDAPTRNTAAGSIAPFPLEDMRDYHDIWIGDRCMDWLEKYDRAEPFFLWAGLVSPHPPYNAPQELYERHNPAKQTPCVDNDDPGVWPQKRAHYSAMVELVDEQVGRMLDVLERKGILDDTLVVFTSDHGEMLGDHGEDGKCKPYDPSSRVPLLARCPALIQPGTVSDVMVELIDLPATCLDAALNCKDVTEYLDKSPGLSLLPNWVDPKVEIRPFAYSEDGGHFMPAYQMVRNEKWKYTLYTRGAGGGHTYPGDPARENWARDAGNPRETLYDMQDDPDECRDLAGDPEYREIKDELKSRLLQHIANTPPPIRD